MAREMFGDVVKPSITVGSKQWYTLPLSILAHVAVIAVLIVIPLLAADVLPTPPSMMGVRGSPAAAAATTTTAAAAAGRSAEAGDGRESVGRARPGAFRYQA